MSTRLLLWDIDSTLVNTLGAGIKALQRIVQERFGTEDNFTDIEIAGRTDVFIASEILRKYGVDPNHENVRQLLDQYVHLLAKLLPQLHGQVLPGVRELLERMHTHPHRLLGLLTGNLRQGAELKLSHYGLWHFFPFGAFADDHHDRNQLGAFACRRALEKTQENFSGGQIDVIGDTGHDIACGKAIGARTIAVATGTWARERLAGCGPDFLFDDLSRVDEIVQKLGW